MEQDKKSLDNKFTYAFWTEVLTKDRKYDKVTKRFVPNFKGKILN